MERIDWVFQALTQAHILALQELLLGRKGMGLLVDLTLMKFSIHTLHLIWPVVVQSVNYLHDALACHSSDYSCRPQSCLVSWAVRSGQPFFS